MKEKFSIKKKKTVLKRFEIFNKEFVQHAEKAGEQRNMAKIIYYKRKYIYYKLKYIYYKSIYITEVYILQTILQKEVF